MRRYLERTSSIIAAILLLQTLFYKFSGAPESVFIFSELGLEPYGRIGIGILELITAGLLLMRKTSLIGAIMGIFIISGALFSHLFILGIEVQNDKGLLFLLAVIVFITCSIVVYLNKTYLLQMIRQRRIIFVE